MTYEGVDIVPDTVIAVRSPSTHSVIGIVLVAADGGSEEVAPAFTHATALSPAQAARVGGSTSQTRAQTVAQLVDDNAGLEVTVPVRERSVPEVHAHAPVLAIGRSHEVGVVEPGAVLRVGDNGVVLGTSATEVVLLEVA
jgi:phage tail sheath protein FI